VYVSKHSANGAQRFFNGLRAELNCRCRKNTYSRRNNYRLLLEAQFEAEERRRRAVREAYKVAVHIVTSGRVDNLRDRSVLVTIVAGASDDNTVTYFELRLARLKRTVHQSIESGATFYAAGSDSFLTVVISTTSVSILFQIMDSFGWFGQSGKVAPPRMMISRPQHKLA
jgi:hypothetical protein